MRTVSAYLADHKSWVLAFILHLVCLYLLFFLYDLTFESLFYYTLLISVAFLCSLSISYFRYANEMRQLESLKQIDLVQEEQIPTHSQKDQLYKEIIEHVLYKNSEEIHAIEDEKKSFQDYFTLWAHQTKLPIAAMNLLLNDETLDRRELKSQLIRLEQYTDMVMAYLRIQSNQSDFLFRKVHLDDILRSSIRSFSSEFIRKKIALDFQETKLDIISDEKWLRFVIEQILSNAIKYTPEQGAITIYAHDHSLIIQDTGIGMAQSDIYRIFDKGYTGTNGRLEKKSSGLGLYLCKQILDQLHHAITIESKVNQGTKVLLDLSQFQGPLD